jgi:hypothetical protein
MHHIKKLFAWGCAALLSITLAGCTVSEHPRARAGNYPSNTSGGKFIDADALGRHNFRSLIGEKDGIVYTARGGDIDIGHLRIAADNVYYLNHKVREHLANADTEFTYKLNTDPSIFYVRIEYPADFKLLSDQQKQVVIDKVSLELAQYCTWNMVQWHEVLTWFGYKSLGVLPEFASAFSWEDGYSNLLGTIVAARAIGTEDPDVSQFNDNMTRELAIEIAHLGGTSAEFARDASEKMRGVWYEGNLHTDMLLRNLDMGFADGMVTPTLIPGVCPGAKPQRYPAPTPKTAESLGFKVALEIEPHEFEKEKYLSIIYPAGDYGRIIVARDMPKIMDYVRTEALQRGYLVVPEGTAAYSLKRPNQPIAPY